MATLTDDGLVWLGDKALDDVNTRIDAIAVGTGQNESGDASTLGNEVYRADYTMANVEFVDVTGPGAFEGHIEVQGGTEVPANTQITEIGVFAGGDGGGGTLVIIDEFDPIEVGDGHTEEFTSPATPTR